MPHISQSLSFNVIRFNLTLTRPTWDSRLAGDFCFHVISKCSMTLWMTLGLLLCYTAIMKYRHTSERSFTYS